MQKINLFVGKHALVIYFRYCSHHRMKIKLNSDFYVLMLIKNYKQLENRQTNKMKVQIIRQTKRQTHRESNDRDYDRESIGLRREGERKRKRGRERGRGKNTPKNSKKDSFIFNSHLNHKLNATCTCM